MSTDKRDLEIMRLKAQVAALRELLNVSDEAVIHQSDKLEEAMRELLEARDEAIASSKTKSEFLANMSHEIRTPIHAIIGMSELVEEAALSEEQRDFVGTIRQSALVLLELITDILDYSKIEAGSLVLEIRDFDLVELVEGSIEILDSKAKEKNVSLMSFIEPELDSYFIGAAASIRQVLLNLVGNAVKFTDAGEVLVKAEKESSSEDRTRIRFSVVDTGIGMEQNDIERMFEPFSQLDGSITRKYGGTGLGLSISKRLLEMLNSHIEVKSIPGQGSTFSFAISLETSSRRRNEGGPVRLFGPARVLLISSMQGSIYALETYLNSWGLRTAAAAGIDQAVNLKYQATLSNDPFDLVFLEPDTAGKDAFSAMDCLKTSSDACSCRYILVGTDISDDYGRSALSRGFAAYLLKPVKQKKLFDCLSRILQTPGPTEITNGFSAPAVESIVSVTAGTSQANFRKVLVVEDSEVNVKVACLQLKRLGFDSDQAEDGKQAVEQCIATSYDLILMDCQMPILDGYEAARRIREHEAKGKHRTPIIAVTAHATIRDKERCIEAGMDDFITKPVTLEKLKTVLEKWLPGKPAESK